MLRANVDGLRMDLLFCVSCLVLRTASIHLKVGLGVVACYGAAMVFSDPPIPARLCIHGHMIKRELKLQMQKGYVSLR